MATIPNDLGPYLVTLQRRITGLEEGLKRVIAEEQQREERLDLVRSELHASMTQLGDEVRRVEDDLLSVVQQTRSLIHSFKDSARPPEFSRLQQRIEAWKGERAISRVEFKKLLTQTIN